MIFDLLENSMIRQGFLVAGTAGDNARILRRMEQNRAVFLVLIDSENGRHWSTDDVQALSARLRQTFREGDTLYWGDPMFLIVTARPSQDAQLAKIPGTQVWLIRSDTREIMIYEDQPSDFYGLKAPMEAALSGNYTEPVRREYDRSSAQVGDRASQSTSGFRNFPVITVLLILINVIAFLFLKVKGALDDLDLMLELGANYAPYVFVKHEYWRLLTCMFMHFDFAHLFSNMLYLGIVGYRLEKQAGRIRFLLLYMLSGLVASLVSALYHWYTGDYAIAAGASGAVYGLIGASFLLVIREKDKAALRRELPRLILVMIFIIYSSAASGNVDGAAHIGGFAGGALLSLPLVKTWRQIYAKKKSQQ